MIPTFRTLAAPVTVSGRSVIPFQNSQVRFEPHPEALHWCWSPTSVNGARVTAPMRANNSRIHRFRNITFMHPGTQEMHIAEHVLPMVWLGLSGVCLVADKPWLPYLMPGDFWAELQPHVIESNNPIPWNTCDEPFGWHYPKPRNGHRSGIEVTPRQERGVAASIVIDYPGLGSHEWELDTAMMSESELLRILSVGPQGWYAKGNVALPKLLRALGWSHFHRVVWPDYTDSEARQKTLQSFAEHRFLDLLGALALMCEDGHLFACNVRSVCAGHEADLNAIQTYAGELLIHPLVPADDCEISPGEPIGVAC